MVLPLVPVVLGAGALLSALAGLKKGWDATQNFSRAADGVRDARSDWHRAAQALESRREAVSKTLNALAIQRMEVASHSLSTFARLVDQVAAADFHAIHIEGYEAPVEAVPMRAVEASAYEATEFLQHGVQSAVAGSMVGAGVGQAVGMFGVASTGTAISGLSGAAATNATLAWLGGGSLASGGLGMAGGTMVLGGVVAGPVLLVMGYLAAGKSEQALTQAQANAAALQETAAQLASASVALDAIEQRAREVAWVLGALDERFQAAANRVQRALGRARREREAPFLDAGEAVPAQVQAAQIPYASFSEKDRKGFDVMVVLGSALYRAAKIEILDEQGQVTRKSEEMIGEMHTLMEAV